jgi:Tfp pilus assembly protein FimV
MAIPFDTRPATTEPFGRQARPRHLSLVPPLAAKPVSAATYMRRRLVALFVVTALALAAGVLAITGANIVFADRGGIPATVPAVGERVPGPTIGGAGYVAQPGDTLWGIAQRLEGAGSVTSKVEALIALNGGARIEAGQWVALPPG